MASGATWDVNARAAAGLAWSLCLLTVLLLGFGLVLWASNGFPLLLNSDVATGGPIFRVLVVLTFALIAVVGLLIATRQPTNAIGWIILASVVVSTFDLFAQNFVPSALAVSPNAARFVAWLVYPLHVSAALVSAMLLLFPDGRLPSSRWRWVLWLSAASGLLQLVQRAVRPGPLRLAPNEPNPFGSEWAGPVIRVLGTFARKPPFSGRAECLAHARQVELGGGRTD